MLAAMLLPQFNIDFVVQDPRLSPGIRSSSEGLTYPDAIPMGGDWRRAWQHGALRMQRVCGAVNRRDFSFRHAVVNASGAVVIGFFAALSLPDGAFWCQPHACS